MKTQTKTSILLAVTFATVAIMAPLASADDYSETHITTSRSANDLRSISVGYADLNLANPAGRRVLQGRIRQAARQICGPAHLREAGSIYQMRKNRECQEQAVSAAMRQLSERQIASLAD